MKDRNKADAFGEAARAVAALRDAYIEQAKRDVMWLLEWTARIFEKIQRRDRG